ncbi:ATP-binding protein [Granulicella arctica]|uniref:ATP-binding protein n=1 Tax=Granulicella arctica TaxID=940613 RepID=UPI0021DFD35F|nr:ATP-binding protein [Granulicella arctica]
MWAEIWDVVEPLLRSVRESQEAIYRDDLQLFVSRNGFVEEAYFSFSYGPIFRQGEVAGIFSPCTETTAYVLQRRRLALLRKIAAIPISESIEEAAIQCVRVLSEDAHDVSFAALYLCASDGGRAQFVAQTGLGDFARLAEVVSVEDMSAPGGFAEPLRGILRDHQAVILDDLQETVGPITGGVWQDPQKSALLLPLRGLNDSALSGVLVAGISPRLPYNEEYRVFLDLLAEQISNVLLRTSSFLEERRRSDLFSSMFKSAPAFIAILRGPEHVFQFTNAPYTQLIGNRDVIGLPVIRALPEVREQGFVDLLDRVFRSGTPYRGDSVKVELQRGEGGAFESRYITFVYQPTYDASENVDGIFVLGMDVSETVAAHEALRKSEKLSAAGRLAATIAHEVNNPLEALTNLLYLVRDGVSSEGATYLSMAEDELTRIAHITKQTLAFYRESTAPLLFDVSNTVDSVVVFYRKQAQRNGVELRTELQPECNVFAIEGELKQVLSNLIANSLDALSGRTGSITIWTRTRNGCVHMAISDNGTGIPSNVLSKIWEPFFTTKATVGTGLGLWVTREIIEKHRGSLRVRTSTSGCRHGTTFSIIFPYEDKRHGDSLSSLEDICASVSTDGNRVYED